MFIHPTPGSNAYQYPYDNLLDPFEKNEIEPPMPFADNAIEEPNKGGTIILNDLNDQEDDFLPVNRSITRPNGTVETGLFEHGILISGKKTSQNGKTEEGLFKNGFLNGLGRICYPNKEEHVGNFQHGLLSGWGEIKYGNGKIESGYFDGGLLDPSYN